MTPTHQGIDIDAFDPDAVTPTVFLGQELTAVTARELNTVLRTHEFVSLDTETVFDPTPVELPPHLVKTTAAHAASVVTVPASDIVFGNTIDGEAASWRRSLDVDGPGDWRVTTIASRDSDGQFHSWLFDMKDMDRSLMGLVVAGLDLHAWNATFDAGVLARDGVYPGSWRDGALADAVLRTGTTGGDLSFYRALAKVAIVYLNHDMTGKDDTRLSYDAHTPLTAEQIRYAASDAVVTTAVAIELVARLNQAELTDTWLRNCGAQLFIASMTRNGLPIDVDGYISDVIVPAKLGAAVAAEKVALLTSGSHLLEFISVQARDAGLTGPDDAETFALSILADQTLFTTLCTHLLNVTRQAAGTIAEAAGGATMQEDLFSASCGPVTICPFVIDDDVDIRKWISKQAPLFVATIIATSTAAATVAQAEQAACANREQLALWAGGKTRLVVKHDLDTEVLPRLLSTTAPDVTDGLRDVARELLTYRRGQAFLTTYSHRPAPVRIEPDWNINATPAAKKAFNDYAPQVVRAYFAAHAGGARLFTPSDSLTSDTLTLLASPLADALAEYRRFEKRLSTYGEAMLRYVHPPTGRIHSKYKQALTGTHRLSSASPNAQNYDPKMKPYLRPRTSDHVFVAIDLSQAELRGLADVANDSNMLEAFRSGDDLHERTAGLMFSLDMKLLKALSVGALVGDIANPHEELAAALHAVEPYLSVGTPATASKESLAAAAGKAHKTLRQKAKKVSFGYAYGIGAEKLARDLTIEGVDTTKEEAQHLIARFDVAYPAAAAWMQTRSDFIGTTAADIQHGRTALDFDASWALFKAHTAVKEARTALGKGATSEAISEKIASDDQLRARVARRTHSNVEAVTAEALAAERTRNVAIVRRAEMFEVPAVLRPDRTVWMFASSTVGGAKRHFPVLAKDWEWGMVTMIVRSRDRGVAAARERWVQERTAFEAADAAAKAKAVPAPVRLTTQVRGVSKALFGKELEKQFEGREGAKRRTSLVEYVFANVDAGTVERIRREGMTDRIRAMRNQYRNHPIQGIVADAMLLAMGRIHADLSAHYPDAQAVQSVHDSIVIECHQLQAVGILELAVKHMEACLNVYAPTVVAKADGDIQRSLDSDSIIEAHELNAAAAA